MKYLEGHKNCGLKVGDKVIVTRVAKTGEKDWENYWEDIMNETVGKEGIIKNDYERRGFLLKMKNEMCSRNSATWQ